MCCAKMVGVGVVCAACMCVILPHVLVQVKITHYFLDSKGLFTPVLTFSVCCVQRQKTWKKHTLFMVVCGGIFTPHFWICGAYSINITSKTVENNGCEDSPLPLTHTPPLCKQSKNMGNFPRLCVDTHIHPLQPPHTSRYFRIAPPHPQCTSRNFSIALPDLQKILNSTHPHPENFAQHPLTSKKLRTARPYPQKIFHSIETHPENFPQHRSAPINFCKAPPNSKKFLHSILSPPENFTQHLLPPQNFTQHHPHPPHTPPTTSRNFSTAPQHHLKVLHSTNRTPVISAQHPHTSRNFCTHQKFLHSTLTHPEIFSQHPFTTTNFYTSPSTTFSLHSVKYLH